MVPTILNKWSRGAAAADFNHYGVLDVVAGPYILWGPDYTKKREIYIAKLAAERRAAATDAVRVRVRSLLQLAL
jgi:hypothetical protein